MRSLKIGIIGTGRIGALVAKSLSGFGCNIYAHDKYVNESIKEIVTYTELDTIYKECDVITLHMPLTEENYHIIDEKAISKMKDGVILINTARGQLIDSEALIQALESQKVGGAGLDAIEGEEGVAHVCVGTRIIDNKSILYLKQFPNVILTQHYGFFTEEATSEMVRSALLSLKLFETKSENPYMIV